MLNLLALTCTGLADELSRRYGKGIYHATALYREIIQKGNIAFAASPEFARSPALAARITEDLHLPACRILDTQEDDGVIKFAISLSDGELIESVLIPAKGRNTLCISSQVGCRMGCRFCTTGRIGLIRNLLPEEITWQLYAARTLLDHRIDNIVFMGMGEPLDNFDNVAQAISVIGDQRGFDIPYSRICISTAGHVDGIRKLKGLNLPRLRLAVSINAADDGLRSRLMPINRKYPLEALKTEMQSFPFGRDGVVFIEYVLMAGVNDTRAHAKRLARYLDGIRTRVNVIACNGGQNADFTAPDPKSVERFCRWLAEENIFVRLRRSRGQNIMAACGQLGMTVKKYQPLHKKAQDQCLEPT